MLFRNAHKNFRGGNGIMFYFELAFSAVINTEVTNFYFQTTLGVHIGVGRQIIEYSNLKKV